MKVNTYKQFYNENNNYTPKNKIQDPHTYLVVKYENQVFFVFFFLYLYNSQIRGDFTWNFSNIRKSTFKIMQMKIPRHSQHVKYIAQIGISFTRKIIFV